MKFSVHQSDCRHITPFRSHLLLSEMRSHFPRNRLDESLLLFQLGEWVGVVPHRLHPLLHPPGGSNSYAIAFGTAVGDRNARAPLGRSRCAAAVRQIAHYWMEQLPATCAIG